MMYLEAVADQKKGSTFLPPAFQSHASVNLFAYFYIEKECFGKWNAKQPISKKNDLHQQVALKTRKTTI